MRDDTFEQIRYQQKERKVGYDSEKFVSKKFDVGFYSPTDSFNEDIAKKRYDCLDSLVMTNEPSLYRSILKSVFQDTKLLKKMEGINNIRTILRNLLFTSLYVRYEFTRTNQNSFNEKKCHEFANKKLEEAFFLRNRMYINSEENIAGNPEDKYKSFPNIFYTKKTSGKWEGLCRIRILQLLKINSYTEKEIVGILNKLYSSGYIEFKIASNFSYELIKTVFDDKLQDIKYELTSKGEIFLKIIKHNHSVLYYFCLDSQIPAFLIRKNNHFSGLDNPYINIYNQRISKDRGYGPSMIKSVITFVLFVLSIHKQEIKTLKTQGNTGINVINTLESPFDLDKLDCSLREIYNKTISNYESVDEFFKKIGNYNDTDEELNKDLYSYNWRKWG